MGFFSSISVRNNGQDVVRAWFNDVRTAGVNLEAAVSAFFGAGYVASSATIANNQGAAANVTGMVLDKASYKSGMVTAEIRRKTSSAEVIALGTFAMVYRALTDAWELAGEDWKGDETNVTLSITAAGQVQYVSDSMAGTGYAGTLTFRLQQIG